MPTINMVAEDASIDTQAKRDTAPSHFWSWALLVSIVLLLYAINGCWINKSPFVLRDDSARHAFSTYVYAQDQPKFLSSCNCVLDHRIGIKTDYAQGNKNDGHEVKTLTPSINLMTNPSSDDEAIYPFPKLVHALAAPLTRWGGFTAWPFFLAQAGWFTLLLAAIGACGKALHSRRVGRLAVYLAATSIALPQALRSFTLDFPLAAVMITQMAFYLYSQKLTQKRYIWGFIICIPLLSAIKIQFLPFEIALLGTILLDIIWGAPHRTADTPKVTDVGVKRWKQYVLLVVCLIGAIASTVISGVFCNGLHSYVDGHMLGFYDLWVDLKSPLQLVISYALFLKNIIAGPLFTWIYLPALIAMIVLAYRRPSYRIILWPLLIGPTLYTMTSASPRWFAPLWPLRCLVLALAIGELDDILPRCWAHLGKAVAVFFLVFALLLSGGWILPNCPVTFAPALSLNSEFDHSYIGDIPQTTPPSFWDCRSHWAPTPFFTIAPYPTDWVQLLRPIVELLPSDTTIYQCIPMTKSPRHYAYEITAGTETTAWLNFSLYALTKNGHPYLEVQLSDPPRLEAPEKKRPSAYLVMSKKGYDPTPPKQPAQDFAYVLLTQEPSYLVAPASIYPQAATQVLYHAASPTIDISLLKLTPRKTNAKVQDRSVHTPFLIK